MLDQCNLQERTIGPVMKPLGITLNYVRNLVSFACKVLYASYITIACLFHLLPPPSQPALAGLLYHTLL